MAEKFLYLTTRGRKTGKSHKIEIWYVEHDNCFYLCAEHREKSDWVRNIIADPSISFYVAEREQAVPQQKGTAMIVEAEDLISELSRQFDEKYKWSNGLFVRIC